MWRSVANIVINDIEDFTRLINTSNDIANTKSVDNYNQKISPRIFYRGEHGDYDASDNVSSNVAGIYRNKYQESTIYHAYMRRFYKKFKSMHNFSKLTYMQHFGVPTCLLDITSNALVALYFACSKIYSSNTKDDESDNRNYGVVHIILPKNGTYKVFNSDSDSIEILSTLALLKKNAQLDVFGKIEDFNNTTIQSHEKLYRLFYNIYVEHRLKHLNKYYSSLVYQLKNLKIKWTKRNKRLFNKIKNKYLNTYKTYDFVNFIHKIRQDVGDFSNIIDFENMLQPIIVQPAINNKRVEAQQGYFIFENHPTNDPSYTDSKLQNKELYISRNFRKKFWVKDVLIPNNKKSKILKELNRNYGINRATLFPDYENVAKYIKDEYSK